MGQQTWTDYIPGYHKYGSIDTVSVPSAGPFELENEIIDSDCPRMRVYISGGLLVAVSYKQRYQSTYEVLGTVPPLIDLNPGDKLRFTYTALTPPVIKVQAI